MKKSLWLVFMSVTFAFSVATYAEEKCCWIDGTTGKSLPTLPTGMSSDEYWNAGHEPHNAVSLRNGHSAYRVPCPSPTPDPTHTIKRVLQSIPINIGIGVGGGHTDGRDDHKGDHHTSSTTSKKTVTAGCKCHPCTCSPCTCH